ncbi:MAG: hypothetical protein M9958_00055 [Chitinophagales bacterium]|nr:hypothetical protein [Chitinophagales bacterium]
MKMPILKFALLFSLLITVACNKDKDKDINTPFRIIAKDVSNSSSTIITAKVIAEYYLNGDFLDGVIAQAPYSNNGFTIELPATVDNKYLDEIIDFFGDYDDIVEGSVSISNKDVLALYIEDVEAFDSKDKEIGEFYLYKYFEDNDYYTSWIYVESDVTIKGKVVTTDDSFEKDIEEYDLALKKGWNVIYESYLYEYDSVGDREIYTDKFTSSKPSGVVFNWEFMD